MKRFIVYTIVFLASSLTSVCKAQNVLVVERKEGTPLQFSLDERPLLTFNAKELVVETPEVRVEVERVLYSQIAQIYFTSQKQEVDGLDEVEDVKKSTFAMRNGFLQVSGLAPSSMVHVYSVDGKHLRRMQAGESGSVTLDVGSLQNKVVIVKTPTDSFKVMLGKR